MLRRLRLTPYLFLVIPILSYWLPNNPWDLVITQRPLLPVLEAISDFITKYLVRRQRESWLLVPRTPRRLPQPRHYSIKSTKASLKRPTIGGDIYSIGV